MGEPFQLKEPIGLTHAAAKKHGHMSHCQDIRQILCMEDALDLFFFHIEDEKAFIEKMERQAEMVEALGLLRQEAGPGQ